MSTRRARKPACALEGRELQVFKALMDEYLRSGSNVASGQLSDRSGIRLSSASVRTVLAQLERHGFVRQDHVASGRVPTTKGMRLYVSSLVRMRQPSVKLRRQLKEGLSTESTNVMAKSALEIVAKCTGMISLVTLPSTRVAVISQIQFVSLSPSRVMVVLVTTEGEVRNRLIEVDPKIKVRELEVAARLFNERFAGHTLAAAKLELRNLSVAVKTSIADLLTRMMAKLAAPEGAAKDSKVYVAGSEQLYGSLELKRDAAQLRDLVKLLSDKEILLDLLEKGCNASDVSVFIGAESGISELADYSMIAAPYEVHDGKVIGALGLIGSVRMPYSKIVPLVDMTSHLMNDALVKISAEYS